MNKIILYLIVLFFSSYFYNASSQAKGVGVEDLFLGVGASNYYGDIGGETVDGKPVITALNKTPSYYIGMTYSFFPRWSIKFMLNYIVLKGTDEGSKFEASNRNYEFKTNLYSADLAIVFKLYSVNKTKTWFSFRGAPRSKYFSRRTGLRRRSLGREIYILLGLGYGISKTTPNSFLEKRGNLQLNNNVLLFPIGMGGKYSISDAISIGIDGGVKFSSSDYLDGLHTSSSEVQDMFFFTNVYISYSLNTGRFIGNPGTGFGRH